MFKQTLSKRNRFLLLGVAVSMLIIYFTPLWSISLAAPQYPEGLKLHIWIRKIVGGTDFDLQNINLLNHYIGMQKIAENAIPELLYMPYVLYYLIAGAVAAFIVNRLFMVYLGLINLGIVGVAGVYDFWRWEYNFGHNLDPHAAMKFEGMTYQPPLIGCKDLLNITACSWPHVGASILFAVGFVLAYIVFTERMRSAKQ